MRCAASEAADTSRPAACSEILRCAQNDTRARVNCCQEAKLTQAGLELLDMETEREEK